MCLGKAQVGIEKDTLVNELAKFAPCRQVYHFYLQICVSVNNVTHRLTIKFREAWCGLVDNLLWRC